MPLHQRSRPVGKEALTILGKGSVRAVQGSVSAPDRPGEKSMLNDEVAIRQRAYEIWQAEGAVDGQALSHWLRAQEEISRTRPAKAGPSRSAATRRRTKAPARSRQA